MRTVRAFAAAGVANRVVAICDNDTAAADALLSLNESDLPSQICVMRYPDLELAREYPTLGPPTKQNPSGSLLPADVNGFAASIELYLGRDVLTGSDGKLRPAQWTTYISGMKRYQGEVTGKNDIQQAFRAKVKIALQAPGAVRARTGKGSG